MRIGENMAAKRYKGLLLDFYGALVKVDDGIINRIVAAIGDKSPITDDRGQILRSWNFFELCSRSHGAHFRSQRALELESLRGVLEKYKADLDAEELSAELFSYWRSPDPFPSSSSFLAEIGIPVCVVSNIDAADLAEAIGRNGWEFDHVVTSEECRAYKPRPEPFVAGFQRLGFGANEVLHVGDSLTVDVAGGNGLGIDCAWVNRRNRPIPPNGPCEPTYVVADTGEVAELVR